MVLSGLIISVGTTVYADMAMVFFYLLFQLKPLVFHQNLNLPEMKLEENFVKNMMDMNIYVMVCVLILFVYNGY